MNFKNEKSYFLNQFVGLIYFLLIPALEIKLFADNSNFSKADEAVEERKPQANRKIATIDDLPGVSEGSVEKMRAESARPGNEVNSKNPSWIDITGSTVRLRGERDFHTKNWPSGTNTQTAPSNRSLFHIRLRPDFNLIASNSLKVLFEPQITKILGSYEYFFNAVNPSGGPIQSSGVTSGDPILGLHQAVLNWNISENFEFNGGRMILKYGDELVLGPAEWGLYGRTFDGLRLRVKYEAGIFNNGTTDLLMIKFADGASQAGCTNSSNSQFGGDITLYGVYNRWSLGKYLKEADLYLLYQADGYSGPVTSGMGVIGFRTKSTVDAFDYRIEYTQEGGTIYSDVKGNLGSLGTDSSQIDGELGYTFELPLKPHLSVGGFYAGANYNQLYPSAHSSLGYADVLGRKNIQGAAAHLVVSPLKKLYVKLDAYLFQRANTNYAPSNKSVGGIFFNLNKNGADIGNVSASSSNDLGNEIDLTTKLAIDQNVNISSGVSVFNPGQYFIDNFGNMGPGLFYYVGIEATL